MAPPITKTKPAFEVNSEKLGARYCFYVAAAREKAPAVAFFDGDYFFDPAVEAYRELRAQGQVPEAHIVGVGYGAGFAARTNHRGRDYTPAASRDEPGSGGAARFLQEFTQVLWPEVERRFPVDRGRSAFAGHSLGSLFVLYALFQPEPFFRRALVGAPSIWWADRAILGDIARLREKQDKLQARLFIGVGEDETPSMLGDLALFERQLAARPFAGLEMTRRNFPGRDHYNVVPDLLRSGLPAVLAP